MNEFECVSGRISDVTREKALMVNLAVRQFVVEWKEVS